MKQFYTLLLAFVTTFAFAQLTPPSELQSYYGTEINTTGLALKTELITLTVNNHTNFLTYSEVWEALRETDLDPTNANDVLLIYGYNDFDGDVTTDRTRGKFQNGGNVGDWNREHTYPRSLGNPDLGSSGPGSDAQMLRPSDVQRNGQRGNQPYADGTGLASGNSNGGWYPGDEWKGDCARIIMYMYLRYGDQCLPSVVGIGSNAATPDDMIDLFLQWNAEDPVVPGGIEDVRNSYHANTSNTYAQGNRNPFIDNPYLATLIWGGPDAENRWESLSVSDVVQNTVKVFPNPVTGNEVTIVSNLDILAEVYDVLGKKVTVQNLTSQQKKLNISGLSKGVYLIRMNSTQGSITKKLIKQ
ncbi:MAG: T9SS type A sorting domain-containing protein [Algicola sp.]|nr:T9SS type A sorting domain-containing protein [Algicola sp.]